MRDRRRVPLTDEQKAYYAGYEAAKRFPQRNDVVALFAEYKKKIKRNS